MQPSDSESSDSVTGDGTAIARFALDAAVAYIMQLTRQPASMITTWPSCNIWASGSQLHIQPTAFGQATAPRKPMHLAPWDLAAKSGTAAVLATLHARLAASTVTLYTVCPRELPLAPCNLRTDNCTRRPCQWSFQTSRELHGAWLPHGYRARAGLPVSRWGTAAAIFPKLNVRLARPQPRAFPPAMPRLARVTPARCLGMAAAKPGCGTWAWLQGQVRDPDDPPSVKSEQLPQSLSLWLGAGRTETFRPAHSTKAKSANM